MITKEPISVIKHRSDKKVVNLIYEKFSSNIASLICQTGNIYEVILKPTADFDKVVDLVRDYSEKEQAWYFEHNGRSQGDGFCLLIVVQVGNDKKEVIAVNSKSIVKEIEYLNRNSTVYFVQIAGSDHIDIYQEYVYMGFLVKHKGDWYMQGLEEYAQFLGKVIENYNNFEAMGFRIEDYKKYGES
mgnify:CR=1 FL=1